MQYLLNKLLLIVNSYYFYLFYADMSTKKIKTIKVFEKSARCM